MSSQNPNNSPNGVPTNNEQDLSTQTPTSSMAVQRDIRSLTINGITYIHGLDVRSQIQPEVWNGIVRSIQPGPVFHTTLNLSPEFTIANQGQTEVLAHPGSPAFSPTSPWVALPTHNQEEVADITLDQESHINGNAEHVEDISAAEQHNNQWDEHHGNQDDFNANNAAHINGWDQSQDNGWDQGQGEECPGCFDQVYEPEAVYISCGHAWHRDCLNNNFRNALLSRANWPAKCCDRTSRIDYTMVGFFLDDDVAGMLSERQDEFNSVNPIYCSNLECGKFIPDAVVDNGQTYWVTCSSCEKTTCKLCKCPSLQHGMPGLCPAFIDKETQELAEKEGWKICPRPGCNSMIERTEGCDTMDCPACKTSFCYRCGSIVQHGIPCNCAGQNAWVEGLGGWMMGGDADTHGHDEDGGDEDQSDGEANGQDDELAGSPEEEAPEDVPMIEGMD